MGEMIYLLRGVDFNEICKNGPIPIRNKKEIHKIVKSATLIGFLNRLAVLNDLTEKSISQPLT